MDELTSLVNAFEKGAMGTLTIVMNHHDKGKRYSLGAMVMKDEKIIQIIGEGASMTEAINNLSQQWGEI